MLKNAVKNFLGIAVVVALAVIAAPSVAFCDATMVQLTYTGYPSGNPTWGGDVVDPYYVKINGADPAGLLSCDDFAHTIGSQWWAYQYTLTQMDNHEANTAPRFSPGSPYQSTALTYWKAQSGLSDLTYEQMYYAAALLAVDLYKHVDGSSQQTLDTVAIWDVFDVNTPPLGSSATAAAMAYAALTAVNDNFAYYQSKLGGAFYIYTPFTNSTHPYTGSWPSQEFLGLVSGIPVVTPDGGLTLMLLGGALLGLETLRRKFRA
jgi:hypothetical protein